MGKISQLSNFYMNQRLATLTMVDYQAPLMKCEFVLVFEIPQVVLSNVGLDEEGKFNDNIYQVGFFNKVATSMQRYSGGAVNKISMVDFLMSSFTYPDVGLSWNYESKLFGHPIPSIKFTPTSIGLYCPLSLSQYRLFHGLFISKYASDGSLRIPKENERINASVYLDTSRFNREKGLADEEVPDASSHIVGNKVKSEGGLVNILTLRDIKFNQIVVDPNPQSRDLVNCVQEIVYSSYEFPTIIKQPK